MAYVIESLVRQDIKQLQACLHHLAGSVEAYIGDGRRWGAEIEYVLQKEPWGTAGAIKWACQSVGKTILAVPADVLVDFDAHKALTFHRDSGNALTVVVHKQDRGSARPVIINDTPSGYETGIYIFEPSVLAHIPTREAFDSYDNLIPILQEAGEQVSSFEADGYWNPLNTFTQYHEAQFEVLYSATDNHALLNGMTPLRYPSIEGNEIASGIWVGQNHAIHPTAQLKPPVYIGRNCKIGHDVELGPAAIVGSHVVIDESATVQESAILRRTYVGRLVNVENKIVYKNLMVDPRSAEHTEVADTFLLGETSPQTIEVSLQEMGGRLVAFFLFLLGSPIWFLVGLLTFLTSGRLFEQHSVLNGLAHDDVISIKQFQTQAGLGSFFAKWGLHRWPTLWAVISGKLALVGVAQLDPTQLNEITESWQRQRFDYPVGFTGLWYTNTRPGSTLDEILVSDTYYVATRSWREDMRILRQTPIAWWRRSIQADKGA